MSHITESTRERRGRRASSDSKSNKENGSKARYSVSSEKRAPNMGRKEGIKPTKINASIELPTITLQHHKVCGRG